MAQYFFLCSSLPMLVWGEPIPIAVDGFLAQCEGQLPDNELELLTKVTLTPDSGHRFPANSLVQKYYNFDTCLRNALMPGKAGNQDISGELRPENDFFSEISGIVSAVSGSSNLLESEQMLDLARYQAINSLLGCESFTWNALAAYKLKLLLLEKYTNRTKERGEANLDAVLDRLQQERKQNEHNI